MYSDVLAFLDGNVQPLEATSASTPKAAPKATAATSTSSAAGSRRKRQRGSVDVPASGMRKVIAARLTESKVGGASGVTVRDKD